MMRLLVSACLLAMTVASPCQSVLDLDQEWTVFKQTYGKQYSPEEEVFRQTVWLDNLKFIQQHNLEADRGVHTFWMGMNRFGDLTRGEFVATMKGFKMSENRTAGNTYLPPSNMPELPSEVDWRKEGYVTPVKDQKQCSSCWAFSVTGSLEGQHFKKTGDLVSLSEQNLVDCSWSEGNLGCGGGYLDRTFIYIKKNNGIDTEASYPYEAREGECRFKRADVGATLTGYTDVTHQSEPALESAIATVGPISVAIDSSQPSFQFYKNGVYYDKGCSSTKLDHAVLAVGYGSMDGQDYYIVKNSWGTSWGNNGYILMSRNRQNNCGIATLASYPTV